MPHLDTSNVYFIASVWMALALAASLISIRLGVSVALCEIGVGVIGGNFLGLHTNQAIVEHARREGLAGATVFRGMEGYGLHRHLHTSRLVDVSDDLPVIVEIVDTPERIRAFLPTLEPLIPHGAATLSPVSIIVYRTGRAS